MKNFRLQFVRIMPLAATLFFCFLGLRHTAGCQQNEPSNKAKPSSGTGKPVDKSASTNIFDRSKNKPNDDDFIVVHAGHEIRIAVTFPAGSAPTSAINEGKVVLPVRDGFTTAIPAGSKVHLRFSGSGCDPIEADRCGNFYQLLSVELNGTIYKTETDGVGYSSSEMIFTLVKPLRIAR